MLAYPGGMSGRPKILGQLLVEAHCVDEAVLEEALGPAREPHERIGETLVRIGAASAEDVARALSLQLGLPYAPPPLVPDPDAFRAVQL